LDSLHPFQGGYDGIGSSDSSEAPSFHHPFDLEENFVNIRYIILPLV
jgi:hypothetical protein